MLHEGDPLQKTTGTMINMHSLHAVQKHLHAIYGLQSHDATTSKCHKQHQGRCYWIPAWKESVWEVTYKYAPGVSEGDRVTWRWVFHQVAWSASPALRECDCQERIERKRRREGVLLSPCSPPASPRGYSAWAGSWYDRRWRAGGGCRWGWRESSSLPPRRTPGTCRDRERRLKKAEVVFN